MYFLATSIRFQFRARSNCWTRKFCSSCSSGFLSLYSLEFLTALSSEILLIEYSMLLLSPEYLKTNMVFLVYTNLHTALKR
ncbi:hypothetical protein BpHYR1_000296 [Brachionus plicatilis]|uniref:Uncharacterized protein n=1 Tax=Brachionus plicatilis TaxID=10195 RepID=A0A3M7RG01_BRAPC|nr:hypothetical protein BpHYR1_000296 [Brachionus plicatilis]